MLIAIRWEEGKAGSEAVRNQPAPEMEQFDFLYSAPVWLIKKLRSSQDFCCCSVWVLLLASALFGETTPEWKPASYGSRWNAYINSPCSFDSFMIKRIVRDAIGPVGSVPHGWTNRFSERSVLHRCSDSVCGCSLETAVYMGFERGAALCVCVYICCSGCHRGKFHKLICAVREAQFRSLLLLLLLLLLSPLMISFFMLMIMPVLSRIIIHPDIRCSHLCPGPVRCHLFYIRCPPTHRLAAGAAAREDWEPCRAFHRKCDGTGGSGGREKLCVCAERKGEMA